MRVLKIGSRNGSVKILQRLLGIPQDGVFGPNTEQAVKDWQRSHGLVVDGIVGPKTLRALRRAQAPTENIVYLGARYLWAASPERVKAIFGAGQDALGKFVDRVSLSTPAQASLFLGQLREEVGPRMRTTESLNYSVDGLIKTFRIFRNTPALAYQFGRKRGRKANQVEIANHAYAHRVGNGGVRSGDGWRFRGAGLAQLTGRRNYEGYHDWLKRRLPEVYDGYDGTGIMHNGADQVSQGVHAFLSAVYFWDTHNLGSIAARGVSESTSNAITSVWNRHTHSYDERWEHSYKVAKYLGAV